MNKTSASKEKEAEVPLFSCFGRGGKLEFSGSLICKKYQSVVLFYYRSFVQQQFFVRRIAMAKKYVRKIKARKPARKSPKKSWMIVCWENREVIGPFDTKTKARDYLVRKGFVKSNFGQDHWLGKKADSYYIKKMKSPK